MNPDYGTEVTIGIGEKEVKGFLKVPFHAQGLILFAHGSGSSRFSSRNNFVAGTLNEREFGTLVFDLLTDEEAEDRRNVFDISLLASRLQAVHDWVRVQEDLKDLPVGYFGASTGAAAALEAAAKSQNEVQAVVSRGGRPDLAVRFLSDVLAPTLLIVGEHDPDVIELNERAFERLTCEKDMVIVPGATHLFEEPGTLEVVAELATNWFEKHLVARGARVLPKTEKWAGSQPVPDEIQ